eukprot:1196367-Prorocentrum_minimum.AAC.6
MNSPPPRQINPLSAEFAAPVANSALSPRSRRASPLPTPTKDAPVSIRSLRFRPWSAVVRGCVVVEFPEDVFGGRRRRVSGLGSTFGILCKRAAVGV